ncbi:hypothetical protein CEXT_712591 [Caerostris extrusa]|uniref:Uncharacterized protein n=1 Tax=Caerostris extrusa TaxID=172846 RepID=A0AAV4U1T6_CAEEX|nr:hypothetical protein CEXT_712591 [Caerostris extrusa]
MPLSFACNQGRKRTPECTKFVKERQWVCRENRRMQLQRYVMFTKRSSELDRQTFQEMQISLMVSWRKELYESSALSKSYEGEIDNKEF